MQKKFQKRLLQILKKNVLNKFNIKITKGLKMENYNQDLFLNRISEIISVDKNEFYFKQPPKDAMVWLRKKLKDEQQPTNFMILHNNIMHRVYFNSFLESSIWFIKLSNGNIKQILVNGKKNYNTIDL
jgi:hypothetical protein